MNYLLLLFFILCVILVLYYFKKSTQLEFRINQNKFSQLFENSDDIILILNDNFNIVTSNKAGKVFIDNEVKDNSSFLEMLSATTRKEILAKIADKEFVIKDENIDIIDINDSIISYSLSLTYWEERNKKQYGVTLKDLTTKLLYQSEEEIISEIYRISELKEDQFSFLHSVLLAICKSYHFDFGQVWVKNKDITFYISNNLKSSNSCFKEHLNSLEITDTASQLFNHSEFRIEPLHKYKLKDFSGIPEAIFKQLQTVIFVPITHLESISISFLLFSKSKDVKQNSIKGLFNILVLIGELNYKKTLAQELNNKHILLAEAEKISGSGSWSIDTSDFKFKHISEGFKDIYELEDVEDLAFFTKVFPDDLPVLKNKIDEATANKVGFFLEYRISVESRVKYIHMRGIPKYDLNNLIIGYHGSITDVSMLKEKNIELELVNQELAALNNNLEQFTYIASHDLQEPLRKIRTFGNLLLEKYEDQAPGYEYIHRMQNASERMQKLISDLLDYSRISRSNTTKETVDFNKIIAEVLESFELGEVTLTIGDLPTSYLGHKTQLFQLFLNLLSNAVKFKRDNVESIITISHQLTFMDFDEMVAKKQHEITFEDNGIGFDTQYVTKIFEMFQRLHSKNEYPGTGIGLAICQKITENHDGVIKVSSTLGLGSVFKIYLPIQD